MTDVCRVCLRNGEFVSIYSSENDLQISYKVMSLSAVRISEDDKLPGVICRICLRKLNYSYEFKLLCEESDMRLRKELYPKCLSYSNNNSENDAEFSDSEFDNLVKCETELGNKYQMEDNIEIPTIINEHFLLDSNDNNKCNQISVRTKIENNLKKVVPINRGKKRKNIDNISNIQQTKRNKKCKNSCAESVDSKRKRDPVSTSTQCYTCGKVVSSRFRLKCHMRIHTGERPFTCQYCNKNFALAYNLKVHERIHTGEKPLLCGICGKTFAQSAGLVAHSRLHTGETPYKCNLCPMEFKTCSHLQYHIRLHTGEKNYECGICNRAFITKGDLTQHNKTHTGERAHVCAVCGLRLTRSYHLTRHMLTHTGEKPHRCSICGSAYAQKGDLVRHIKKHGSENIRNSLLNQANNNPTGNMVVDANISGGTNIKHSSRVNTEIGPLTLAMELNMLHQHV